MFALRQTCYVVRPLPYRKRILYVVGEAFRLPRGLKQIFFNSRILPQSLRDSSLPEGA